MFKVSPDRREEELKKIIKKHSFSIVIDIRKKPISKGRKFSAKSLLEMFLSWKGVDYIVKSSFPVTIDSKSDSRVNSPFQIMYVISRAFKNNKNVLIIGNKNSLNAYSFLLRGLANLGVEYDNLGIL